MLLTTYWDFCRRFTFGIQIDVTKLRVWFRSRSVVFLSDEFDINKVWKLSIVCWMISNMIV